MLFPNGSSVGNYAADDFDWTLTSTGSLGFDPTLTTLQFQSLYEANYTVSNVWLGTAAELFALPTAADGDFNGDGLVNLADYGVWRDTFGQQGDLLAADADGNGTVDSNDYAIWKVNLAAGTTTAALVSNVPEPTAAALVLAGLLVAGCARRSGSSRIACGASRVEGESGPFSRVVLASSPPSRLG